MSNTWRHFRRMLTGLLAAALIVTSVPVSAYAAETVPSDTEAVEQTGNEANSEADEPATEPATEQAAPEEQAQDLSDENTQGNTGAEKAEEANIGSDESDEGRLGAHSGEITSPAGEQTVYAADLYADPETILPLGYSVYFTDPEDPWYWNDENAKDYMVVPVTVSCYEDGEIAASRADGTKDKGYWVGVALPEYEGWTLTETDIDDGESNTTPYWSNSEKAAYFRMDNKDELEFDDAYVDVTYSKAGSASKSFRYVLATNLSLYELEGFNVPEPEDVLAVKASTTKLSENQLPAYYTNGSTGKVVYKEDTGEYDKTNVTVRFDEKVKKSKAKPGQDADYYSNVAVPVLSENGLSVEVWSGDEDPIDPTHVSYDKEVLINGTRYRTASVNMADLGEYPNNIVEVDAKYTYAVGEFSYDETYKYYINFNYNKDNGLPKNEDIISLLQNPTKTAVYYATSTDAIPSQYNITLSSNDADVLEVTSDGLYMNRTASNNTAKGFNIAFAYKAEDTDDYTVSGNTSLIDRSGSVPEVRVSANNITPISVNGVDGQPLPGKYIPVSFDLSGNKIDDPDYKNYVGVVELVYENKATGEQNRKSILVDFDGVKIDNQLPKQSDLSLGTLQAAPLSNDPAESAKRATDYAAITTLSSDNMTLYTGISAKDVAYYTPSGNSSNGYYVGIKIPVLSENNTGADFKINARYAVSTNSDPDFIPSNEPTAVITKAGKLDGAGSYVDSELSYRVAYFDASKVDKVYVHVAYDAEGAENFNVDYFVYEVDLSNVQLDDKLPTLESVASLMKAAQLHDNPSGNLVNQGTFSFDDRSVNADKEMTISPNNTSGAIGYPGFKYFMISADELPASLPATGPGSEISENGYWVGIGFPASGNGVSDNEAIAVTYEARTDYGTFSPCTAGVDYVPNVQIDNKYYDVFYLDVHEFNKHFKITYTNKASTLSTVLKYYIDLSKVITDTELPGIGVPDVSFPVLTDDKGAAMPAANVYYDEVVYVDEDSRNYQRSISANEGMTAGLKAFTLSSDYASAGLTGNKYWVGVAIPSFGTGVSKNDALKDVAYEYNGAPISPSLNAYKIGDKYYDVFFVDAKEIKNDSNHEIWAYYENRVGVRQYNGYKIDFSEMDFDDGLPSIYDVSEKGEDIIVAGEVAEGIASDDYDIADPVPDVSANVINVSVNASSMKPAKYKSSTAAFYAGVTIYVPSENEAYSVRVSANGVEGPGSLTAATAPASGVVYDLFTQNFNLETVTEENPARIYVEYTSTAKPDDVVTYVYDIDFSGVKQVLSPETDLLTGYREGHLDDINNADKPYATYSVEPIGGPVYEDDPEVVSLSVNVINTELKYHVERSVSTDGFGYWTGIALPQGLQTTATSVKYIKGFGYPYEYDLENWSASSGFQEVGLVRTSEETFGEGSDKKTYDQFLFRVDDPENYGYGFIALELKTGGRTSYVVYRLYFDDVEVKPVKYTVKAERIDPVETVLYEKDAVTSSTKVKVKFSVSDGSAPVKGANISFSVIGSAVNPVYSPYSDEDLLDKISGITGSDGTVDVELTLKDYVANYTFMGCIYGGEAGDTYSVEVYDQSTESSDRSVILDPVNQSGQYLEDVFTLAYDSDYKVYGYVENAATPAEAVTFERVVDDYNEPRLKVTAKQNTADAVNGPLKLKQVIVSGNGPDSYVYVDATGSEVAIGSAIKSTFDDVVEAYARLQSATVIQRTTSLYAPSSGYYADYDDALELSFYPDMWEPAVLVNGSDEYKDRGLFDGSSVKWKSSDENVATVSAAGASRYSYIQTHEPGSTKISATIKLKDNRVIETPAITLEVKEALQPWSISGDNIVTELGVTHKLTANYDKTGKGIPVTWSVEKGGEKVLEIDAKTGIYTPIGLGEATVIATAKDGQPHTFPVTVTGYDSIRTILSPDTYSIATETGSTTITPSFGVETWVDDQWRVVSLAVDPATRVSANVAEADKDIASVKVETNGKVTVTGKKAGTAKVNIMFLSENKVYGKSAATATVLVGQAEVPVTGAVIAADLTTAPDRYQTDGYLYPNQTLQLMAIDVEPANYTDATFTWGTTATVFDVDSSTGLVTSKGKGKGTVTLTVTNKDHTTVVKNFDIEVKNRPHASGFSLNVPSTVISLKAPLPNQKDGGSYQVNATITPADAQETFDDIEWTSSDPTKVTVNKGLIVAKASTGSNPVTITATLNGKSIPLTVNVEQSVDKNDYDEGYVADGAWVGVVESYVYDGTAKKPEPNVYYGDVKLVKDVDYSLSYKNNINASKSKNKPTVTINLKGNYKGKIEKEFSIEPRSIEEADANDVSDLAKRNTSKKWAGAWVLKLLKPVINYNGKKLRENTDYELYYYADDDDYDEFAAPGSYTINVKGIGNYSGETTVQEVLLNPEANPKPIAASKYTIQDFYFAGSDRAVKNSKGVVQKNQALSFYSDNGSVAIEPDNIVVTAPNGYAAPEEGTDYTVTITNNRKIGTATVTITGTGTQFYGSKSKTFKIVADKNNFSTVNVEKPMFIAIDGNYGEVEMRTEKNKSVAMAITQAPVTYVKGGPQPQDIEVTYNGWTLTKGVDYTVKYAGVSAIGENTGSVTITGKGTYFSGSAVAKYNVEKANIADMTFVVDDFVANAKGTNLDKYGSNFKATAFDSNGKALKQGKNANAKGVDYYYEVVALEGSPAFGSEITVNIKADGPKVSGFYTGETSVTYKIIGNDKFQALKGSKYEFIGKDSEGNVMTDEYGEPEKIASNKYYQKYAGTPIVLDQSDLVIRVKKKVGRTTHWEVLEPDEYEIVNWQNNNKVGTSTVTIRGLSNADGGYGGLFTVKFKITK